MIEACNSGKTKPPHGTAKDEARSGLPPLASEKGKRSDLLQARRGYELKELGVAALVLGILAYPVFGVPTYGIFLSITFSAFGLLFGLIACLIALVRDHRALGLPIAGTIVSAIALVGAICVLHAIARLFAP